MSDGSEYITGVRGAYRGELEASRVYGLLAERKHDDNERVKLAAIAEVEARTAGALEPIARRLGFACVAGEIDEIARPRVEEMSAMSWGQFIERALEEWPPYIDRFEALRKEAPASDARAMDFLVAHERALVEFLRIEKSEPHSLASLTPLRALLERGP